MKNNKRLLLVPIVISTSLIIAGCVFLIFLPSILNRSYLPKIRGTSAEKFFWVFDSGSQILCTPLIFNSLIVFQTNETTYALEPSTGAIQWQMSIPGNETRCAPSPSTANYIILQDQNAGIVVLEGATGKLVWSKQFTAKVAPSNFPIEEMKVSNGILYVARYNGDLTAYDLITGDILWSRSAPERSSLFVIAGEDQVMLISGNLIQVYNAISGNEIFQKTVAAGIVSVASDERMLYLALNTQGRVTLSAIDISTLERIWDLPLPDFRHTADERLYLDGNTLYLSGNYIISVSRLTGHVLWANKSITNLGTPIEINNKIFVPEWQSRLHILNAITGNEIGQITMPINFPWKLGDGQSPTKVDNLLIWVISARVFVFHT